MAEERALPHDHGSMGEEIVRSMPGAEEIAGIARLLGHLGDPSRLRIFWLLCHCEECVMNIAALTGMSSPAVSHHLRLLKSSGLIVSRREGKEMYYRAADTETVASLHRAFEEVARITCPTEDRQVPPSVRRGKENKTEDRI